MAHVSGVSVFLDGESPNRVSTTDAGPHLELEDSLIYIHPGVLLDREAALAAIHALEESVAELRVATQQWFDRVKSFSTECGADFCGIITGTDDDGHCSYSDECHNAYMASRPRIGDIMVGDTVWCKLGDGVVGTVEEISDAGIHVRVSDASLRMPECEAVRSGVTSTSVVVFSRDEVSPTLDDLMRCVKDGAR